jgi:HSP20 family protein
MANLIRRNDNRGGLAPREWDPFQIMREVLGHSPFAEAFVPKFDVKETRGAYVFLADLPGVPEADLDITVTGNRLVVRGKREEEHRDEGDSYYTYERTFGTFQRVFTLPDDGDPDRITADMRGGVLTIEVPRRGEHQPRKISLRGVVEKVKGALGKEGKDRDKPSA